MAQIVIKKGERIMQKTVYACDICAKETSDPKAWFLAIEVNNGLTIKHWEKDSLTVVKGRKVDHVCGQACVIQAAQKWMNPAKTVSSKDLTARGASSDPNSVEHEPYCDTNRGFNCDCGKSL